jgi:hypothetical protein
MRISLGFGIAIVAASMGTAAAQDYKPPPMKGGLWEARSAQSAAGKSSNATTIKMCQTKELVHSSQALSEQLRKTNQCTSESRCAKGPNAGQVTKLVYSHAGDTASHIEVHSHRDGAEDVTILDMKYLGNWRAGMKPGDLIMPDGKVMSAR